MSNFDEIMFRLVKYLEKKHDRLENDMYDMTRKKASESSNQSLFRLLKKFQGDNNQIAVKAIIEEIRHRGL